MPVNTDLFLKNGETPEQYNARIEAMRKSAAPKDPYTSVARNAGAAGLGVGDAATLFGATPEEQQLQKDSLAKTFGYEGFDAFASEVFSKPSKTTEQFYRDAYGAAGLDQLVGKITSRKNDLSQAEFGINDNPWLSEASRSGRVGRLQELANADINNWQQSYDLGLGKVRDLVAANAADVGTDERMREARFNYLLKQAETNAASAATSRIAQYLPEYIEGRNSTATADAPKTITVGDTAYAWNPTTMQFEVAASNPKSPNETLTPYQRFQATQDIQKNLQRYTQGAREVQRQYSVMEEAYSRLARGEAKDLNATSQTIITTFNKILDPSSVVRETEYARSPEGQSLIDSLYGKLAAISQGGPGLTPDSLREFVDLARVFVQNAQTSIAEAQQLAAKNAEAFGLDSSLLGLPGSSNNGSSGGTVSLDSWADF
jgi:hypothetical protein